MTVRTFIIGSLIATAIGGAIWALIVTQLSPHQAGPLGFILFFLSLFLTAGSFSALVGYFIRRLLGNRQFPAYIVRTSLRQGVMIGSFFVVLLLLQLGSLYRWWLAVIIIVLLISFELVFLSYDRNSRRKTPPDLSSEAEASS